ncbi:MAG: HNH endonuclease [Caulobacterales bacterium]
MEAFGNYLDYVDRMVRLAPTEGESQRERMALALLRIRTAVMTLNDKGDTPNEVIFNAFNEIVGNLSIVERALAGMALDIEDHWISAMIDVKSLRDQAIEAVNQGVYRKAVATTHPINDPDVRQTVWGLTGGVCAYCEKPLQKDTDNISDRFVVEHVVPGSSGGPDNIANYVPACTGCNSAKGGRHVLHFVRNVLPSRRQKQMTFQVIEGDKNAAGGSD